MQNRYPFVLKPAYKDYLWGGDRISKLYDRTDVPFPCAESWECSDREEAHTIIDNGPLKASTLQDVFQKHPDFFSAKNHPAFPILGKVIDAKQSLSIQVHPTQQASKRYGGDPKTEAWHILDAHENSFIYLGFKKDFSKDEILQAIENNTLQNLMNCIQVSPGETYYIPAGLVHSIGAGCLIYEVQQNSNTTYRLYDWGRLDVNGKQRPLHIEDAFQAMTFKQTHVQALEKKRLFHDDYKEIKQLVQSPYFSLNSWDIKERFFIKSLSCFRLFFVQEGAVTIKESNADLNISKGQSFLIPALTESFELVPLAKKVRLLEVQA